MDISPELPVFNIVRLPTTAVQESRERARAAIHNSGGEFPMRRITISLAPANLKKSGPSYDLPVAVARRILAPEMIVGASARTEEKIMEAISAGADYIGFGPIYQTSSKPDAGPVVSLDGVRQAAVSISKPLVAVGGIDLSNAGAVVAAGCDCVAVLSALHGPGGLEHITRQLMNAADTAFSLREN